MVHGSHPADGGREKKRTKDKKPIWVDESNDQDARLEHNLDTLHRECVLIQIMLDEQNAIQLGNGVTAKLDRGLQ